MTKVATIVSTVIVLAQMAAAPKKTSIGDDWLAGWNSHNAEKVIPIFTDDVFFEDVALGAVSRSSGELRKFATSIFATVPDAKFVLGKVSMERGHGTIEWDF